MMPGLEADFSLGSLDLMASLGVELGRLNDRNDREDARAKERRLREMARARVPIDTLQVSSGIAPGAGNAVDFVLSVGGPDPGYYWLVQRLVVGSVLFDTTAPGDAEIYVTGLSFPTGGVASTYGINGLSLSEMVDHATTMPNIAYYSPHQVIVQEQQNLCALFGGTTGGVQYVMSAQMQVFRTIADDVTYTG